MTSSYQRARYALWNHASQMIGDPVEWRTTPKSKKLVAVAPSAVLQGQAIVTGSNSDSVTISISKTQASAIAHWTSGLPEEVIRSTAETHGKITHCGPYVCIGANYEVTERLAQVGDSVTVRLAITINYIGPLRKAQLNITDVRLDDVAECSHT